MLNAEHVTKAMGTTPWDLGNQVLYELCRQYPGHENEQEIIAKIG